MQWLNTGKVCLHRTVIMLGDESFGLNHFINTPAVSHWVMPVSFFYTHSCWPLNLTSFTFLCSTMDLDYTARTADKNQFNTHLSYWFINTVFSLLHGTTRPWVKTHITVRACFIYPILLLLFSTYNALGNCLHLESFCILSCSSCKFCYAAHAVPK